MSVSEGKLYEDFEGGEFREGNAVYYPTMEDRDNSIVGNCFCDFKEGECREWKATYRSRLKGEDISNCEEAALRASG